MRFIAIKDFERFQHYKGRTPPWIKFYNALLDDYRFLQLPDAARSQLMLIWLVASRHQNRIPNDEKYIAQAIHCTTRLQLARLIESGWLYGCDDAPLAERKQDASNDASKPQARCPQNAPLEVEGEIETEKEIEKETTSNNSGLAGIATKFPNPKAAFAMLEGMTEGIGSPGMKAVSVETLEEAAAELGASGGDFAPHRFKRFVEKVLQRQSSPLAESRPQPNGKGAKPHVPPWERDNADRAMNQRPEVIAAVKQAQEIKGDGWWERMQDEAKAAGRWAAPFAYEKLKAEAINA